MLKFEHRANMPAFGFETAKNHYNYGRSVDYSKVNRTKMVAYIPVIGTLLGAVRLSIMKDKTNTLSLTKNKRNWRIRCAFEIASLGFLLLVPDLIITAQREWAKRKHDRCTSHIKKKG